MNCCVLFLSTIAIISQFGGVHPLNGLNLCISLLGNCDAPSTDSPNQGGGGSAPVDGKTLLTNGFMDFNQTAAMSKSIAMQGIMQAAKMAASHPSSALQMIKDSIQDCEDKFYDSATFVLLSLGQALTHSSPSASRSDLVSVFQELQYISLSLLDTLRNSVSLAFQGIGFGEGASHQVIEAINQEIDSIYSALFDRIPVVLQGTIKAISLKRSLTTYDMKYENNNYNALANDPDAQQPIADLNKATDEAIDNGADPSLADKFRNLITNLLNEFAKVALYNENSLLNFRTTVATDPTLAKNTYIDSSDEVKRRIQKLFTNICLEYGSINDKLSQEQIGGAFVSVEHGNDEADYANKIAKETVLGSMKYSSNIRDVMLNAAAEVMKYGKISFYERTVQGAEAILKALAGV